MAYRLDDRSFAVCGFVNRKVKRLETALFESSRGAEADARASLARLRRLGSVQTPSMLTFGEDVLLGWPEKSLGIPEADSPALNAVCGALEAFALLQQGKDKPVAVVMGSADDWYEHSFGRACWKIEPDVDHSQGVVRRLASIEAACDFSGVMVGVRALLKLMRTAKTSDGTPKSIQLDFGLLAADLFDLQRGERWHDGVIGRWGSSYYAQRTTDDVSSGE